MPKGIYKRKAGQGFKKGNKLQLGKIPWNKGKTKETDKRVAGPKKGHKFWGKVETQFGYRNVKLEKHPNWRGGKSYEAYSLKWTKELKEVIRQRDNYTCILCGDKQKDIKFDVHHIDYDKKNCNPNNLITLCKPCHMKTNFNRDEYLQLFNKLI